MNDDKVKEFEAGLRPLYKELLKAVSDDYKKFELSTFCVQWGDASEPTSEILFVGRATNGWDATSTDLDVLFGNSSEAIFNRKNQMKWVDDPAEDKKYNPNRSAFWRVVKKVSQEIGYNPWYSHVAWSNLYKVAPRESGNPNNKLCGKQLKACKDIFKKEIEVLKPKAVILLTGDGWAKDFLPEGVDPKVENWDNYCCRQYEINGTFYIVSEHPQGKKEGDHSQCIINMLTPLLNNK